MILLVWEENPERITFFMVPEDHQYADVVRQANGEMMNFGEDEDTQNAQVVSDMLCDTPEHCADPSRAGLLLPFAVETGDACAANVTFISHTGFVL